MKKTWILFTLLLICIGSVASLYAFRRNSLKDSWEINTISPNGVYHVQLKGKINRPSQPYEAYGDHHSTFSAFKGENPIVKDVPFYGGRHNDDLFLNLYPTYEWVSESTIRFGEKHELPQSQLDEIVVTNNSNGRIDYLRINFGVGEIFVLLNVAPGEKVSLYASPQTDKQSDISGITCWAMCNGKTIEKAAGFDIRGKYKAAAHYSVDVGDSGINIQSREFAFSK
jgi:hypothetical protein